MRGGEDISQPTHFSQGSPGHTAASHVLTMFGSWPEHEPEFMVPPCVFVKDFLSPRLKIGTTGNVRDFFSAPRKEKLSCFEVWVLLGARPRTRVAASLCNSDQKTGRGHCSNQLIRRLPQLTATVTVSHDVTYLCSACCSLPSETPPSRNTTCVWDCCPSSETRKVHIAGSPG